MFIRTFALVLLIMIFLVYSGYYLAVFFWLLLSIQSPQCRGGFLVVCFETVFRQMSRGCIGPVY